MKAYLSDLEGGFKRTIPIRDWPVNSDHTAREDTKQPGIYSAAWY